MSSAKTARTVWLIALSWAACQFIVPWLVGSVMMALNEASGGKLDPYFAGAFYNLFIGPALVGGIASYCTIALLRRMPILHALQARTVVLVAMAALFLGIVLLFMMSSLFLRVPQDPQPAAGGMEPGTILLPGSARSFVAGFFTWIIPGLLIGYAIADEIAQHGLKLARRQMQLITAGWGSGFALGGGLGMAVGDRIYALLLTSGVSGEQFMGLGMLLPYAINGLVAGLIGAWSTLWVIRAKIASSNLVSTEV